MLNEIRQRIEEEIEALSRELQFELPVRIRKAVELGDLRENSEYKSALERQQFVNARIGHLTQRVAELSQIDVEGMPADRVGFGSRVTVRDCVRKIEVTYTIAAGDYIDIEAGHVSMASAIGRGLMGARPGEEVEVKLPRGARRYEIIALETLPQRMGMA
ncbi:MAG: transcription elongation factor GreA [Gammaproteobacteria bacterium]|nr:transcription elongation factor GreA [Gammaproteobacteria bacterium]MYK69076.1 transcription elongation factor GreA [Gammaproteobacteria bacterium]